MKEEQLSNIYMLMVKPDTTWEEKTDGRMSVIPLNDKENMAIIMDKGDEHHVRDLEKFQVFNIPARFKSFKIKNASKDSKTYLITTKKKESK